MKASPYIALQAVIVAVAGILVFTIRSGNPATTADSEPVVQVLGYEAGPPGEEAPGRVEVPPLCTTAATEAEASDAIEKVWARESGPAPGPGAALEREARARFLGASRRLRLMHHQVEPAAEVLVRWLRARAGIEVPISVRRRAGADAHPDWHRTGVGGGRSFEDLLRRADPELDGLLVARAEVDRSARGALRDILTAEQRRVLDGDDGWDPLRR